MLSGYQDMPTSASSPAPLMVRASTATNAERLCGASAATLGPGCRGNRACRGLGARGGECRRNPCAPTQGPRMNRQESCSRHNHQPRHWCVCSQTMPCPAQTAAAVRGKRPLWHRAKPTEGRPADGQAATPPSAGRAGARGCTGSPAVAQSCGPGPGFRRCWLSACNIRRHAACCCCQAMSGRGLGEHTGAPRGKGLLPLPQGRRSGAGRATWRATPTACSPQSAS